MIDDTALSRSPHGGFRHLDALAISASTLCLIHCLVLPVLIAFLPAIAEWADLGEAFHIVMLVVAVPLSGLTLFGGWRRHRAAFPMIAGAAGWVCSSSGWRSRGRVWAPR